MAVTGSGIKDSEAVRTEHLENGVVKFPPNIHGIYVERGKATGYTRIVARHNDVSLTFVLDDSDCRHLAALLSR